jgi:hypothetical protein
MNEDRNAPPQSFLGRWSRRKIEARETSAVPPEAPAVGARADDASPQRPPADDAPPQLPRVEDLTIDSDFRGFFHPKVDEDLRRSALRKLFSDPHFNVMDGLDTYVDDYSKTEPIPPEMLAGLRQAQKIIQWAENREDEPEEAPVEAGAVTVPEEELALRERPPVVAAPEQPPETGGRGRPPAAEIQAEPRPGTTGAPVAKTSE